MLATVILLGFLVMLHFIKKSGIVLARQGKAQGLFIILFSKMFFWFSVIEIFYVWWEEALFYILPISLILFGLYLFLDRRFFVRTITQIKEKKNNSKKSLATAN